MDLNFSAAEEAFRTEVREFLKKELPADIRAKSLGGRRLSKDDFVGWHKTLFRKGWVAPLWPTKFGGCAWTPVQQHIYDEERAAAGAPATLPFGLRMVAPVIMAFGSPQQQQFFLPRILDGTDWWCQGYSEPGSGSDLASLSTSARREGDEWVINGQKIWTSHAHEASMIYMLVRTSKEAKRQEGISLIMVPMDTP